MGRSSKPAEQAENPSLDLKSWLPQQSQLPVCRSWLRSPKTAAPEENLEAEIADAGRAAYIEHLASHLDPLVPSAAALHKRDRVDGDAFHERLP